MASRRSFIPALVLLIAACGNAGRIADFDKAHEACAAAQRLGHLASAELACERALAISDAPDFPPTKRSGALYELGRIKRQLSKFSEAETLQRQALVMEEQRDKPDPVETARRLTELAINLAGQNRWPEGAQVLERLVPIATELSGKARREAGNVLRQYSIKLSGSAQAELAERFGEAAETLRSTAPGSGSAPAMEQGQDS